MLILSLIFAVLVMVSTSSPMIGAGLYRLLSIKQCEGDAFTPQQEFIAEVTRRKFSRTHDSFNCTLTLADTFDNSYGIRIDIYKFVDGGCKLYSVLADTDMIHFMNSYAKGNVKRFLELAGFEPPEFPLPKGTWSVSDYIYDYSELPDDGLMGTYYAHMVMLRGLQEVGCLDMVVEFNENPAEV